MKWKHALGAFALTSLMAIATVISAASLGITPRFPLLLFDSAGITEYDATTDLLSIEATPISLRFTGVTPPRFVNPTGVPAAEFMSILIEVGPDGSLVGGVVGDDLIIVGEVDEDGDNIVDFAGVLLTGEVLGFGFLDTGQISTDEYDLRFQVTGGELAPFSVGQEIGVTVTSENSSFDGGFTVDFGGGAKGIVGPVCDFEVICFADLRLSVAPGPSPCNNSRLASTY